MAYQIKEVLLFLKAKKTRREIDEKFNLSNSNSYRLLRWMSKTKTNGGIPLIETSRRPEEGCRNWVTYYKTTKEAIEELEEENDRE